MYRLWCLRRRVPCRGNSSGITAFPFLGKTEAACKGGFFFYAGISGRSGRQACHYLGLYFDPARIVWQSVIAISSSIVTSGLLFIYLSMILKPVHTTARPGDSSVK